MAQMVLDVQARSAGTLGINVTSAHALSPVTLPRASQVMLIVQEAAMRVGRKSQSLPLWDEFALLYHRHSADLAGIIATADIAEHLAEIATLCLESSAPLSASFANLATLDGTSLPGIPSAHTSSVGAWCPYILCETTAVRSVLLWSQAQEV